jgi:hypothetical protein
MAVPVRISCINKTNRTDPHDRIKYVGGVIADGTRWKLSQADAISQIESGHWDFYVTFGGRTAGVIVATSRFGNKYLKTVADDEQPDNLLTLPECPPRHL